MTIGWRPAGSTVELGSVAMAAQMRTQEIRCFAATYRGKVQVGARFHYKAPCHVEVLRASHGVKAQPSCWRETGVALVARFPTRPGHCHCTRCCPAAKGYNTPSQQRRRRCSVAVAASPVHKAQWTTGLHSWHKLTGVRIHCHCTRCCAAPEGYLSTAMFAASTGVQLSCNLS